MVMCHRANNTSKDYDGLTYVCSGPMHDCYTLSKWGSKVLGKEVPITAAVFLPCMR